MAANRLVDLQRFHPALGDVFTNFDTVLGGAIATLIRAKTRVLKESGEFARYEVAERDAGGRGSSLPAHSGFR